MLFSATVLLGYAICSLRSLVQPGLVAQFRQGATCPICRLDFVNVSMLFYTAALLGMLVYEVWYSLG